MPEITCSQEGRLRNIEIDLKKINETITGNDGLLVIMTKQVENSKSLEEVTKQQGKNIDKLFKVVDMLHNKSIKDEAQKEMFDKIKDKNKEIQIREEKEKKEKKAYKNAVIATIIAFLAMIIMAITSYFEVNKDSIIEKKEIIDKIKNQKNEKN